jgi:ketopantoate hydroxymethyltransferase
MIITMQKASENNQNCTSQAVSAYQLAMMKAIEMKGISMIVIGKDGSRPLIGSRRERIEHTSSSSELVNTSLI